MNLGNPRDLGKLRREQADRQAEELHALVVPLAHLSSRKLADELNGRGIASPTGGCFHGRQALRLVKRLGLRS